MPSRRIGAPRLIDWTGERLVPWAPEPQLVYEHFHRYLWAQPLVAGRRVLDLGSGEGFGAALLAETAASVTGIDVDARTVEHARSNYQAPNLAFRVASATDLSAFAEATFDAVVAFEVIEHVAAQERLLAEVSRVLASDGVLLVSTPERGEYSDARDFENPFHERELTQDELVSLLGARFEHVRLFAQAAVIGSRIDPVDAPPPGPHQSVVLERSDGEWRPADRPAPLYLLAAASNAELPELPSTSSLSDFGLVQVRELERRAEAAEAERDRLERQLKAEHDRFVAEALALGDQLQAARETEAELRHEIKQMRESVTWQLLERGRGLLYGRIPRDSVAGRLVGRVLRLIGRVARLDR